MKTRHVVESIAAIGFAALTVLTVFVPDWVERITPLRPDSGVGEAEWLIIVALGAVALILAFDVVNAMKRVARSDRLAVSAIRVDDR